jgi:hypothetical protein
MSGWGGYQGEYEGLIFNPSVMGVGGNLTLASFVFAEGHAGIVGNGPGIRGFAGVSLEYLMKKGLGLPVNILVGGEGFISNEMSEGGNMSGWGGYQGEYEGLIFNPSVMGVGGNLTLASFVFAEGHAGIVGNGPGIRGFAGVSLEYLMKKGLGLPVNILVGGEGFISNEMSEGGNMSGWGGLGVRLDYDF